MTAYQILNLEYRHINIEYNNVIDGPTFVDIVEYKWGELQESLRVITTRPSWKVGWYYGRTYDDLQRSIIYTYNSTPLELGYKE